MLFDYEPQNPDELRLKKGDRVTVFKKEDDGTHASAYGAIITSPTRMSGVDIGALLWCLYHGCMCRVVAWQAGDDRGHGCVSIELRGGTGLEY